MTNTYTQLYWIDAFTDQPFGGNPAVVVLDADHIQDAFDNQITDKTHC